MAVRQVRFDKHQTNDDIKCLSSTGLSYVECSEAVGSGGDNLNDRDSFAADILSSMFLLPPSKIGSSGNRGHGFSLYSIHDSL